MPETNEYGDKIVAVGQINDIVIQIMEQVVDKETFYDWRGMINGKEDYYPHNLYGTMEECVQASIQHYLPGAVEVKETEYNTPGQDDFEALNALLYVGGLNDDIASLAQAVQLYRQFADAERTIMEVKERAASDIADIEDYLASGAGANRLHLENMNNLGGVFQAQCDVLALITRRNMETLDSFLSQFLSPGS